MWYMRPVRVRIDVPRPREEVYAAPLARAFVRRGTERAMRRLAGRLPARRTAGRVDGR